MNDTRKVIQGRNPRLSVNSKEIEYIKGLIDKDISKNQKFNRDDMLFKLQLYKKLEEAK
jgi:hypothetical protein